MNARTTNRKAREMQFNWTAKHENYLLDLRARHAADWDAGRKVYRNVNGRNRHLTERQYVIWRFQKAFITSPSDQAIWAKYNRVNGLNGKPAARRAAAKAAAEIANRFQSDSSPVILTKGMTMENWDDLGLTYLGSGVSRKVFALDADHVLKVAIRGYECNKTEVAAWKKISATKHADKFAPVVAADPAGKWLVMKRVVEVGVHHDARRELSRIAHSLGVSDIHNGNVGRTADGKAVVIDYGF